MRGLRTGLLIMVISAVLAAALLLSGCGSSGTAQIGNPVEFFMQARESMKTAASFHMTGTMVAEFENLPETGSMNYAIDMIFENQEDGETLARMLMDIDAQGLEMPAQYDIEVYISGDEMYMRYPGLEQWIYQDIGFTDAFTTLGQGFSPQDVMKMLDAADSVEVLYEDKDSIVYSLTLDPAKLIDQSVTDQLREKLAEQGVSEEDFSSVIDMMEGMFVDSDITITVEKKSGLLTGCEMDFGRNMLDYMRPMFDEGTLPQDASMTMHMEFQIDDYGKAFDIELPEETRDAVPLEDLIARAATSS